MSTQPGPDAAASPGGGGQRRAASEAGRFSRLGVLDTTRAAALLRELGACGLDLAVDGPRIGALAQVGDPDAALLGLVRLSETAALGQVRALLDDPRSRVRLLSLLGGSPALTDHLVRHPDDVGVLAASPAHPQEDGYDPPPAVPSRLRFHPGGPDAVAHLRAAYRRELVRLAAWDLSHPTPQAAFDTVAAGLADLAAAALRGALEIACARNPDAAAQVRLAVIGMGKLGGRELNYLSDVDVIYVAEPRDGADEAQAMHAGMLLAEDLAHCVWGPGKEPALWQLDANLRPEGRNGPLVRTLESHRAYLDRWAKTWEFQALLKARWVAGDEELGSGYCAMVEPRVWRAVERENFVHDAREMRLRVERNVPAAEVDRQLKLGPGGLRDVEFSVQLLQLVHGRLDESLRVRSTLDGLGALAAGGYVSRSDATSMQQCYRFLRLLEHRIQLYSLKRTHLMPTQEAALRRLSRASHIGGGDPDGLLRGWHEVRREVRRLHQELFYRPLLPETAKLTADEAVLDPQAARTRLGALGYRDPAAAVRHIAALTEGMSRRAAIQRQLLPVMLGWLADGVDPDAGLLAFRRLSDELGGTPWYLRMLRDSGVAGERLAHALSTSRYVAELLGQAPASVQWFGSDEDLMPRTPADLHDEAHALAARHATAELAATALGGLRRREITRLAAGEVVGVPRMSQGRRALSDLAGASISALLAAVRRELDPHDGVEIAVVGMGSLGAYEMGFGSDADILVVHRARPGTDEVEANRVAEAVAKRVIALGAAMGPHAGLVLDADLRPEGKAGPLSRSLGAYEEYYQRWSQGWERQALLRARPVGGDAELASDFIALIDPLRYPQGGLDAGGEREARRMKARIEDERVARKADAARHLKLGPGTMSDVEWVAQLLQLRHAAVVPALRQLVTLDVLDAAANAGLLAGPDRDVLAAAWRRAACARDAVVLWTGRRGASSQVLPHDRQALSAISRIMGYPPGQTTAFEEDYLRGARQARAVFTRIFYPEALAPA